MSLKDKCATVLIAEADQKMEDGLKLGYRIESRQRQVVSSFVRKELSQSDLLVPQG